jgi:DNA-binding XRE family transcriptional regulator
LIVDRKTYFRYNKSKEVMFLMKQKNFDIWLAIGLNILHYRKEQGLTQIQLAEKCNISRTYMQKIETAATSCSLDTLIDIAEALKIPLKKLFEFKD